jgi:hypothetical protein
MKKINEIFAFVAEDDQGEEILGTRIGEIWLPLVGDDMERMASLKPLAQSIAEGLPVKVRLFRFSVREEVEF